MYPWFRLIKEVRKARRQPPLGLFDAHLSDLICWPWDLDPWVELNNGRTLTLYDLGRVPMAIRCGLTPVLREKGWGLTVAGSSVRYRKRVQVFQRLKMVSRLAGWDHRFLYMDQSMWRGGDCTGQVLIRTAIVSKSGLVAPAELAAAMGWQGPSPELPRWIRAWTEADAERPWPPEPGLPPGN